MFLTFWLVMVIVGKILFAGLGKLRAAGVGAPAPQQVRAAAAVAGIVVAVGMMGFAATTAGTGNAAAAPCPGGGPATCGPTGPELTFTPPPAQTTAPGGQQDQQDGQDQQGIATSPAKGGDNGPGIQAQTPEFGTPGQQAPNIPGNEQPGHGSGQQQQPAQGQQSGQQSPAQTTAPGRPTQTGQPTPSGPQPTPSTVTITQPQSQCPAPGAAGAPGAGGPGSGAPGGDGGTTGGPDGDNKHGPPSWAYLVAEATGLMAGRRRTTGGAPTPAADAPTDIADDTASLVADAADQAPVSEQLITSIPDAGAADTTDEASGTDPAPEQQPSDGNITKELPEEDSTSALHSYTSTGMRVPMPGEYGPFTPEQQAAQQQLPDLSNPFPTSPAASSAAGQQAASAPLLSAVNQVNQPTPDMASAIGGSLDRIEGQEAVSPLISAVDQATNPPMDPAGDVLEASGSGHADVPFPEDADTGILSPDGPITDATGKTPGELAQAGTNTAEKTLARTAAGQAIKQTGTQVANLGVDAMFDPRYSKYGLPMLTWGARAARFASPLAAPAGMAVDVANGSPAGRAISIGTAGAIGATIAIASLPVTAPVAAVAAAAIAGGAAATFAGKLAWNALPEGGQQAINGAASATGRARYQALRRV